MKSYFRWLYLVVVVISTPVLSQTDSVNVVWDPNTEIDIYRYHIQRSVNSTTNFVTLGYVFHPDTGLVDTDMQPGNEYFYQVAALDSSSNQSPFSVVASVGLPSVDLQLTTVEFGQDTTFTLSSIISDPDHTVEELQVTITAESNATVTVVGTDLLISANSPTYIGPASFTIEIEDPDGMTDIRTIDFNYVEPFFFIVNIPDAQFDEDLSFDIQLDTTVLISNYTPDQVTWGFVASTNLDYTYDANTRTLTVFSAAAHWFGTEDFVAIGMAPDQSSVSDTFAVTINSINDPPVNTVPTLFVSNDAADNIIDLTPYMSDADHANSELTWTFGAYSDFDIVWEDQANNLIQVIPLTEFSSDTSSFTLTDPIGASDVTTVVISVEDEPPVEFTVLVPPVVFNEDLTYQIQMDTVVTHSNYADNELTWSFNDGQNLDFNYQAGSRLLTINSPVPNWNGVSQFAAIATAPDQTTASDTFQVTVLPVNDPPEVNVTSIFVSGDPDSNVVDFSQYAIDIDNNLSDLTWSFTSFNSFQFTIEDAQNHLIRITPLDTINTEAGFFTLTDPQGAFDSRQVTINVTNNPNEVFIFEIADQSFNEDRFRSIRLDTTITIFSHPLSQISWAFNPGENLDYTFNSVTRVLTIESAEADWNGSESFEVVATAPDGRVRRSTFTATIRPLNDPPLVSVQDLFISQIADSNLIDLKPFGVDVDNTSLEMTWNFWGFNNFDIIWENETDKIIKIVPLGAATLESGNFSITDPGGLSDTTEVTIQITDGSVVYVVDVPDVQFDEDGEYEILMDTCLTVSNYAPGQITWTFSTGPDLAIDYAASSRKLTIESLQPDWFGSDEIVAIATAPNQVTRTDTFFVTIDPVNDVPASTLESFFVSPFSNNIFDLKLYASDVDNEISELQWEFWGYSQYDIEWENEAESTIRITPLLNASTETGFFRVRDPFGDSDTSQVDIVFSSANTPPHIDFFHSVVIAEDDSSVIDLVHYVVDSTNSINELTIEVDAGDNITVDYNIENYRLTIIPDADWFGATSLTLTATDPFGLSDEQELSIVVERRNDLQALDFNPNGSDILMVDIQTEVPSTVDFSYWITTDQIITISNTNFLTAHSIRLVNLEPSSEYEYRATIMDENGRQLVVSDSTFTTGLGLAESDGMIVYPNPIKPSVGHREMIFINMPEAAHKVLLFSLLGEKLYEEEVLSGPREHRINIFDNGRLELASGLYIYVLKDDNSQVLERGKIVMIR